MILLLPPAATLLLARRQETTEVPSENLADLGSTVVPRDLNKNVLRNLELVKTEISVTAR
jgi:hypothetical protein